MRTSTTNKGTSKYIIEKEVYSYHLDLVRVYKEDKTGKVSFVGKIITANNASDKTILSMFGILEKL